VADFKIKEWIIDSTRNDMLTVKCKKNGFPERPTCSNIALDKQSNSNRDSKIFSLCKDVT
jgi:hypothetical protein